MDFSGILNPEKDDEKPKFQFPSSGQPNSGSNPALFGSNPSQSAENAFPPTSSSSQPSLFNPSEWNSATFPGPQSSQSSQPPQPSEGFRGFQTFQGSQNPPSLFSAPTGQEPGSSKPQSGLFDSNNLSSGAPAPTSSGGLFSAPQPGNLFGPSTTGPSTTGPSTAGPGSQSTSLFNPDPPRSSGLFDSPAKPGLFDSQPKSGGFGSQPKPGLFDSQPKPGGFGSQPKPGLFDSQPKPGLFDSQPKSSGFDSQPKPGLFDSQPKPGLFDSQPKSSGFDSQPKSGGFGSQPKSGGFGSQPKSGGFDSQTRPQATFTSEPTPALPGSLPVQSDGLSQSQSAETPTFELQEAPIPSGALNLWSDQGRTLKFQLNSVSADGIAWISGKPGAKLKALDQEKKFYPVEVPGEGSNDGYTELALNSYGIVAQYADTRAQLDEIRDREKIDRLTDEAFQGYVDLLMKYNPQGDLDDGSVAEALRVVLCIQTLYFGQLGGGAFVNRFVQWVNTVDAGWSIDDTREVIKTTPPTDHPLFWRLVQHQAVRGLQRACESTLREAIRDSKTVPADAVECIEYAIQLLRTYPSGDRATTKYSFRQWRDASLDLREKTKEISDSNWRLELDSLAGVMTGDLDTVLQAANSWYEGVCGLLLYADPTKERIGEYYDKVTAVEPPDQTVVWEMGCAHAISGRILQALQSIESLDVGIAATTMTLCQSKRLLDNYTKVTSSSASQSVSDWVQISYAQRCLANSDLVGIGIEILKRLDTPAANLMIAEALPHVPADNAEEVAWAVEIAHERGLTDVAQSICRAAAMKCLADGEYLEAFEYFDRASDSAGMAANSWRLFEDILVSQQPPQSVVTTEVLEELPTKSDISPPIKECLAPSAVLLAFLRHVAQGDAQLAVSHLSRLLDFAHVPLKFRGVLIAMTISLLTRESPRVLDPDDLVAVMTAIDQWESSGSDNVVAGQKLIEHCLAVRPLQTTPTDWRLYYSRGSVKGDEVIRDVRVLLAQELSRAYLEA